MKRALWAVVGCALAAVVVTGAGASSRDRGYTTDFDGFALGTVHEQDGWSAYGAAGHGCAAYDHAIVENAALGRVLPVLGTRSLRISNAITSLCHGDETHSPLARQAAGEPGAAAAGLARGTRRERFDASWVFTSAAPASEQAGLQVSASPERGDGARMGWVGMLDTPEGLEVEVTDYRDEPPFGTPARPADGCGPEDGFFRRVVAAGLDRARAHTVELAAVFFPGPHDDRIRVSVDGGAVDIGGSWEDFVRWCEGTDRSRTVRDLLFRTAGPPAPATLGKGFLIDQVSVSTGDAFGD